MTAPGDLLSSELFKGLSAEQRSWLAETVAHQTYQPGETIVREEDPANDAFLLHKGSVEVSRAGEGVFARLKEGDIFGEIAMVTGRRRTATIKALTAAECLVIPQEMFRRLLHENHQFALAVLEIVIQRLAEIESLAAFPPRGLGPSRP